MELFGILLKINVSLLAFYILYRLLLRRLTFYNFNRFYLVAAIAVSALLPFLHYSATVHQQIGNWQEAVGINPAGIMAKATETPSLKNVATVLYWSGVAIMACLFFIQLISLLFLYLRAQKGNLMGYKVRFLEEKARAFSFFKTIFINPAGQSEAEILSMLNHENVHVKQWHSIDVLLGEMKRIFCWFNPAAWLMLAAIRENLEFIADRKVLQSGINAREYQYALLNIQNTASHSTISNHFNFSHLKLRITMMNKRKTSDVHLVKYLLTVPLIATLALTTNYAKAQQTEVAPVEKKKLVYINDQPYDVSEFARLKPEEIEEKLGLKKDEIKSIKIAVANEGETSEPANQIILFESKEDELSSLVNVKVIKGNVALSDEISGEALQLIKADNPDNVTIDKSDNRIVIKSTKTTVSNPKFYIDGEPGNVTIDKGDDKIVIKSAKVETQTFSNPEVYVDGKKVNSIADIDPEAIEEVVVLKGASASAINPDLQEGQGIIKITTKNHTKSQKPQSIPQDEEAGFRIYPNPNNGVLNVSTNSNSSNNTFEILDINGVLLSKGTLKNNTVINIEKFAAGTYLIKTVIDGKVKSAKFVKE